CVGGAEVGAGAAGAPAAGAPAAPAGGVITRCTVTEGGNTILTPLFPSLAGSFSTACSRRKSIASRRVASRNSIRGIMIVFSLLVICAVPPKFLCAPMAAGTAVCPYLRTGCSQPFSTCQSWRDRVSLYASSPYLYLV